MGWLYRHLVRRALFTQDAESVHEFTMRWLAHAAESRAVSGAMRLLLDPPELPVELFGLRFPNPLGLAAGMDKEAAALPIWRAMGFGFTELGAVTWHAQPGNPRPRVFRAIPEQAIVNRMGFNNPGAAAFREALARWRTRGLWPRHPVGINLGKSKITPLEKAPEDYAESLRALWALADFFVVNVSSPNTPNLRQLQDKAALDGILAALQEVNGACARGAAAGVSRGPGVEAGGGLKPILVKVAPDLAWTALDEILDLAGPRQVAGLIATNTTTSRPETKDVAIQRVYAETGGLSGRPLRDRSTEVIRHLYRQSHGRVPIIGVGGIFNADDAWEKITAGASLLQVYTGFVFEGPAMAGRTVRGLRNKLATAGLRHLCDAVGTG